MATNGWTTTNGVMGKNRTAMLRITLDTNVLIEGSGGDKASVVARLKQLAEAGKIDIAVTTRVTADKDRDEDESRKEKHLREFAHYPVLSTVGRFGFSRYGHDFYG